MHEATGPASMNSLSKARGDQVVESGILSRSSRALGTFQPTTLAAHVKATFSPGRFWKYLFHLGRGDRADER